MMVLKMNRVISHRLFGVVTSEAHAHFGAVSKNLAAGKAGICYA